MTNSRADHTAAIRAFADWLDANPGVEAPLNSRFLLPLKTNPAVERFAAAHGLTTVADGEGNLSADLVFGPVVYHAYGYVDFDAHCEASAERHARTWAAAKGLEIVAGAEG